ncbi:MAG: hypothetical protein ACI88A_001314 [Paraglaciecola sp.]
MGLWLVSARVTATFAAILNYFRIANANKARRNNIYFVDVDLLCG